LFQFQVGHQVPAGGVDVSESERFSLEIGKRVDVRVATGDEQRVEFEIGGALYQRNDPVLPVGFQIRQAPQVGKIERAVAQRFHRSVVIGWNHQIDRLPQVASKVVLERLFFLDGNLSRTCVGNHTD